MRTWRSCGESCATLGTGSTIFVSACQDLLQLKLAAQATQQCNVGHRATPLHELALISRLLRSLGKKAKHAYCLPAPNFVTCISMTSTTLRAAQYAAQYAAQ